MIILFVVNNADSRGCAISQCTVHAKIMSFFACHEIPENALYFNPRITVSTYLQLTANVTGKTSLIF